MHPGFQRRLRPIAAFILVFFSWFCIEPWNYAVAAPPPKAAPKEKGASEKLEEALHSVKSLTQELEPELAADRETQPKIDQLIQHQKNIAALDTAVQKEFTETEAFLKAKNLPAVILDRHAKAVVEFKQNMKMLRGHLDEMVRLHGEGKRAKGRGDFKSADQKKGELREKLKATRTHLEEKVKEPRHQKLDPNNLPHRMPKVKERLPRLKKEEFTEFQKPVQLAFNGDPSFMLVQSTQDLPTPADLAENIEVQFTPEIQALATELAHNPVKIYNWVHNNIDFVPTYGSIQGANHCLATKQCNDIDTASLLIALLRVSGISARYVYGTIEVPIAQAMNWVGGFTDPMSAANFIVSGGTPAGAIIRGAGVSAIQMEHTWVEAYVDYIPSRGAVQKQGDTWVPMDGSFKSNTIAAGVDVTNITGFNPQTFLNNVLSTATVDQVTGSVTGIDAAVVNQQTDAVKQGLLAYITNQNITGNLDSLVGSRTIKAESPKILPGQLPFRVIARALPVSEINSSLRHHLTFEFLDEFQIPISSYAASLPELASKRITLSYIGATAADQTLLDSAAGSGATSLPVYLISVLPILKVEGNTVWSGPPVRMGEGQTIQISFQNPSQADLVSFEVVAGSYSAFGLNLGRPSLDLLQKRAARLSENYFNKAEQDLGINFNSPVPADEIVGEGLHQNIFAWWIEKDFYTKTLALQEGVIEAGIPSIGVSASPLTVTYLFGVPFQGTYRSLILDIARDIAFAHHKSGDQTSTKAYYEAAGIISSTLEGEILNQLHMPKSPAASTVAILVESNRTGVPIYEVTQSNVAQILPLLQQSAEFKVKVQDAIAAGKTVITPKRDITLGKYAGSGYIVLDPITGAAGYLIDGGLAGGACDSSPSSFPVAKIPPNSPSIALLLRTATASSAPGTTITSTGEVLVASAPGGGAAGGSAAGLMAASIIAVTVVLTIFLTATQAGDGSEVSFYLDPIGRTIQVNEDYYNEHVRARHERDVPNDFTRSDFNNCLQGLDPERVEVWFRNREKDGDGRNAIVCALAPERPGKVLFIVYGGENYFSLITAFIPDEDPNDKTIKLPISWPYVFDQVSKAHGFNLHLYGDATTDPIKPYTINIFEQKAEPK